VSLLTLPIAVRLTEVLWALSLLVQTAEYLRLEAPLSREGVWQWAIQREELSQAPSVLRALLDALQTERAWHGHLVLRVMLGVCLLAGLANTLMVLILFLGTVAILVRWRGAFNGGSDFMTLVVVTGLLIGHAATPWVGATLAWRSGLGYIAVHTLTSYFLSGMVKLRYRGWRNGRALPSLLDGGLYGPLPAVSPFRYRPLACVVSWAFILWECSVPIVIVGSGWALAWCAVAPLFHFMVYWHFGLNRFFWAWCAALPALAVAFQA
jgi:hypothetical protein